MRATNLQVLTDQVKIEYRYVVIYGPGDEAHKLSPSDHNEDDTPGSRPEQEDSDNIPEHRAIDIMLSDAFTDAEAEKLVQKLVTRPANRARLKYVIYKRRIWRRNGGWGQETYTGSDPHTNHVHVSGLASEDNNNSPYDLNGGDDMAINDVNKADSVFNFSESAVLDTNGDGVADTSFPNKTTKAVKALEARVNALSDNTEIDYRQLAAAIIAELGA